ncbi:MAG: hypothetical protein AAGA03_02595 [Planctomycetota bacterium]
MARDDSVIRGGLITTLIFLVLSIALNFFLWHTTDTSASTESKAKEDLRNAQNEVRNLTSQVGMMRGMIMGGVTEAEFKQWSESSSGDPNVEAVETQYTQDMSFFPADFEQTDRAYAKLGDFLVTQIRAATDRYDKSNKDLEKKTKEAESDVAIARAAQKTAEENLRKANKDLETARAEFTKDRDRMNTDMEETRTKMVQLSKEFQKYRDDTGRQIADLNRDKAQFLITISEQRKEIDRLRNEGFETTQGMISYVAPGQNMVTLNLGSADDLRRGVRFGVVDNSATRIKDAKVKATIEVVRVLDAHIAEARVTARPEIRDPIISGDKIYSPFWSPGRSVKIALAGLIDLDGDGIQDNAAVEGMIQAAGAVVHRGELDSSVRFLVTGDAPEIGAATDGDDADVAGAAALGNLKENAYQLGLTILPYTKMKEFLRTMNDAVTTPLGSASRGSDFPVDRRSPRSRLGSRLPEIYRNQLDGVQQGNEIRP